MYHHELAKLMLSWGWEVKVSRTGESGTWKNVPSKLVTDHHGSSYYVAYDTKAEAKKAAQRYAKRLLGL